MRNSLIAILDVGYEGDVAQAGCVGVHELADDVPSHEWVVGNIAAGAYVPGEFWKRELKPLLAGIQSAPTALSACVVDAYVDLGEDRSPGLGRILHDQTGLPVIGIAKSPYPGTPEECAVLRGLSQRPLFVTTAGCDLTEAKRQVVAMAGKGRIPTMLQLVDRLSRTPT